MANFSEAVKVFNFTTSRLVVSQISLLSSTKPWHSLQFFTFVINPNLLISPFCWIFVQYRSPQLISNLLALLQAFPDFFILKQLYSYFLKNLLFKLQSKAMSIEIQFLSAIPGWIRNSGHKTQQSLFQQSLYFNKTLEKPSLKGIWVAFEVDLKWWVACD